MLKYTHSQPCNQTNEQQCDTKVSAHETTWQAETTRQAPQANQAACKSSQVKYGRTRSCQATHISRLAAARKEKVAARTEGCLSSTLHVCWYGCRSVGVKGYRRGYVFTPHSVMLSLPRPNKRATHTKCLDKQREMALHCLPAAVVKVVLNHLLGV